MQPLAFGSVVAVILVQVTYLGTVLAEKVCYFSQEPDPSQNGRLRWVLPGSKSDQCACTSILPGPVYTVPLQRSQGPLYTDTPIFTSNQEEIHDYSDCNDPCSRNPCQNGGTCLQSGRSFHCQCATGLLGQKCDEKPCDCAELHSHQINRSGVYTIYPSMYPDGLEVYCDMDAVYPHGWIVFQRWFDGSVNFTRKWTECRDGFGNLTGEFWLGNEKLRQLTSEKKWLLRIDLTFDNQTSVTKTTSYRWPFRVEGDNYALSVGRSTAGPQLNGPSFPTSNMDNNEDTDANFAAKLKGGWWFGACSGNSDGPDGLTGEYERGPDYCGIVWEDHRIVKCEMKLSRYYM
ncbi:fibrinogen C domain-containing protein 1-A-like [Acanthaster planci]|uniref:Fibrinogen C domain-containing protein 1-A-like n=1 Tax=Acanthaster planci TaxID=133434 RepID=A0A8B7Z5E8_ACAPL|nr:fibrinogen C domain-containing protein 1-A-like [Acanthaster planci]